MTIQAWRWILGKCSEKADIQKHVYPHLLRHSRATHLTAQGVNEGQLREIFGWKKDSPMPSIYVHLSGRDTDSTILELYGIDVQRSKNQFEPDIRECPYCHRENSPNARFCNECNAPLDLLAVESSNKELREQDKLTRKIVQRLVEKAPEVVKEVLTEEEISRELQKHHEAKAVV